MWTLTVFWHSHFETSCNFVRTYWQFYTNTLVASHMYCLQLLKGWTCIFILACTHFALVSTGMLTAAQQTSHSFASVHSQFGMSPPTISLAPTRPQFCTYPLAVLPKSSHSFAHKTANLSRQFWHRCITMRLTRMLVGLPCFVHDRYLLKSDLGIIGDISVTQRDALKMNLEWSNESEVAWCPMVTHTYMRNLQGVCTILPKVDPGTNTMLCMHTLAQPLSGRVRRSDRIHRPIYDRGRPLQQPAGPSEHILF